MDIATVQENVRTVINEIDRDRFIYQLLLAYGKPKSSITRLEKGSLNLSKAPGEVVWKKHLWFRAIERPSHENPAPAVVKEPVGHYDLHALADQLRKSDQIGKHGLRFVVVTDYSTLLAVDTKTAETLDIAITDLDKHSHFFLPWAGLEKHVSQNESLADIKAAYRMAKLYDQICKDNPQLDAAAAHSLNVFLSRLLFCFFAEDTEIFPTRGMFTNAIASHTKDDGTDLDAYLNKLFEVMNTEIRKGYPAFLEAFPYVNGGLLAEKLAAPTFSRQSRKIIIECGELDWSEINPDIFGSMMQAVVHTDERSETGMHYTSVSNIMKAIEPLFLNDLRETFEEHFDNAKGLEKLRMRLKNIRVFDPACGSGNFLIIAFKELRKLEMEIYQRLRELNPNYQTLFTMPQIQLTQFCGIEIDDFAHEIATLSLWLAEHQMNVKFKQNLGVVVPPLPLKPSGNIVCGNATKLNWNDVCPKVQDSEIYVLGNPPYHGCSNQTPDQKADMDHVFAGHQSYRVLDYVACWYMQGARYIKGSEAKLAFVSTNSICQGQQVELLWPHVFGVGLEIGFAHTSFKWSNNAKYNAGVTVVVIGLRNEEKAKKYLFSESRTQEADNINAYLANARNIIVGKEATPISPLPPMIYGNKTMCADALILNRLDMQKLVNTHPPSKKFIKRLMGTNEFINGLERFCLWIPDDLLREATKIPPIAERIERVRSARLTSNEARRLASRPHQFREFLEFHNSYIAVPEVSSERREYVPIGFLDSDTIITNKMFAIDNPELWVFAVLSSKMHNVWIRAVGGRFEQRISYSAGLCYNTFPLPDLTEKLKESLTTHVVNVLTEREKHPEKTIAELYDPDTMPEGLLQSHKDLDCAVERCYRSKPFSADDERLDYLFKVYEDIKRNV
ncbi:MAG: class I SAM-dependent DNA methyltransferase [Ktedonobacteraceae bacterium]